MSFYQIETEYGRVEVSQTFVTVRGNHDQLVAWATRPDAAWPCSYLRHLKFVEALTNRGDLVDLTLVGDRDRAEDMPGDELSAWIDTVIEEAFR